MCTARIDAGISRVFPDTAREGAVDLDARPDE
jgi:hypothetical protein